MTTINRVVLADWDNTLCAGFTVVPWAEFLEAAGLFRGARTLRTLLDAPHDAYDTFCRDMAEAYAAGIAGVSESDVRAAAKTFVTNDTIRLFSFVRDLFAYFAECGLPTIVVTGAPDEPMREYAATLGFSLARTLQLEVQQGCYTGGIACNSGLCEEKRATVSSIVSGRDVVMAFGDSPADVPLWETAAVGFIVATDLRSPPRHDLVRIDPTLTADAIMQEVRRRTVTFAM
jgi:phosphoserine phosphatase